MDEFHQFLREYDQAITSIKSLLNERNKTNTLAYAELEVKCNRLYEKYDKQFEFNGKLDKRIHDFETKIKIYAGLFSAFVVIINIVFVGVSLFLKFNN